jgi:hypothetical protein
MLAKGAAIIAAKEKAAKEAAEASKAAVLAAKQYDQAICSVTVAQARRLQKMIDARRLPVNLVAKSANSERVLVVIHRTANRTTRTHIKAIVRAVKQ